MRGNNLQRLISLREKNLKHDPHRHGHLAKDTLDGPKLTAPFHPAT